MNISRSGFQTACWVLVLFTALFAAFTAYAQTPPNKGEISRYRGIFEAVVNQDSSVLKKQISTTANIDARDSYGRTALHVAAYSANHEAMRLLVKAGANPNALENDRYDIVTIAAVANDIQTLRLSLDLGASPSNITSLYDGTALIAAAHLGHAEVVQILIRAGAPLDHVNNLNWTALIESIVLGDGGKQHTATLKALVDAGAKVNLSDGYGRSPLFLARQNGYTNMTRILTKAGAK